MKQHNVNCKLFLLWNLGKVNSFCLVVKTLVEKCAEHGVSKLVQLSSVFLQCSARWPNVNNRECEDYSKFRKEIPFPAYCDSKHEAEQIIQQGG